MDDDEQIRSSMDSVDEELTEFELAAAFESVIKIRTPVILSYGFKAIILVYADTITVQAFL
jgi:hypothetical protein